MPRRSQYEEDSDDSEWNADEDDSSSADDDEPTIACPECREQIHEDAPQCPYCGHYVSEGEARSLPKPWWLIVGAVLALFAVLSWVL